MLHVDQYPPTISLPDLPVNHPIQLPGLPLPQDLLTSHQIKDLLSTRHIQDGSPPLHVKPNYEKKSHAQNTLDKVKADNIPPTSHLIPGIFPANQLEEISSSHKTKDQVKYKPSLNILEKLLLHQNLLHLSSTPNNSKWPPILSVPNYSLLQSLTSPEPSISPKNTLTPHTSLTLQPPSSPQKPSSPLKSRKPLNASIPVNAGMPSGEPWLPCATSQCSSSGATSQCSSSSVPSSSTLTFAQQLKETKKRRKTKCRCCSGCLRPNCGTCKYCLDKLENGGPNRLKQACILKKCTSMNDAKEKTNTKEDTLGNKRIKKEESLGIKQEENLGIKQEETIEMTKSTISVIETEFASPNANNEIIMPTKIINFIQPPKNINEYFKQVKQQNRFGEMSREEVSKRGLRDYLQQGLDIVFIGINPSLKAAYSGKYYDGTNHFWPCLNASGLIPVNLQAGDEQKLLDFKIGFTNLCQRTTAKAENLTKEEKEEGAISLRNRLNEYRPKIAVFNGKQIYEKFSKNKNFNLGLQPASLEGSNTYEWVMPSTSPLVTHLPRFRDKIKYFVGLKKYRDFLISRGPPPNLEEIVFEKLRTIKKEFK